MPRKKAVSRGLPKIGDLNSNAMTFKIYDENTEPGDNSKESCTLRIPLRGAPAKKPSRATNCASAVSKENNLAAVSKKGASRQPFASIALNQQKDAKDSLANPSSGIFGGNGFSIYCDDDGSSVPSTSQNVIKKNRDTSKENTYGHDFKGINLSDESCISIHNSSNEASEEKDTTSLTKCLNESIPDVLMHVQRPKFILGSSDHSSVGQPISSGDDAVNCDYECVAPSPIIVPTRCPLAPLHVSMAPSQTSMVPKRILSEEFDDSTNEDAPDEVLNVEKKCRITSAEPSQDEDLDGASLTFWTPPDVAAKQVHEDLMYACPEYVPEIYAYMRHREKLFMPYESYMKKQKTLTGEMRAILVDWLVEVQEEYKLADETLFLAVSMVDRFLSLMNVSRQKLQLVGIGSMFIAAKYEEVYPPNIHQMVYITDDTYSDGQMRRMELCLLNTLKFQISVPTVNLFLQLLFRTAQSQRITRFLSLYICQLCMLDLSFLPHRPSLMAAASFCLSNIATGAVPWSETVEASSGYYVSDLYPVMENMLAVWRLAEHHPNQAIRNKYSDNKYFQVSIAVDVLPSLPPLS